MIESIAFEKLAHYPKKEFADIACDHEECAIQEPAIVVVHLYSPLFWFH